MPGIDKKINIKCSIHGHFYQSAYNHLNGQGCRKCGNIKSGNVKKINNEQFLSRAFNIHGNKYIYLSECSSCESKINIKCSIHGNFIQSAHNHLAGSGCRKCADDGRALLHKKDQNLLIEQFNKVHNFKYDYSKIEYKNNKIKINIICKAHGNFLQLPGHHLNGVNCPKCNNNGIFSKVELEWLKYLNIPDTKEYRMIKLKINNKLIKPDAYDPITKTIYEFYGDYWHGNPKIFDQNQINLATKKTFGELYSKTMEREFLLKSAGYNIVSIWESDWKTIIK